MIFVVKRSAPVRVIMTRPMGKSSAPIILIRPGASDWYQGAALTESVTAQLVIMSEKQVWRNRTWLTQNRAMDPPLPS